MDPAYVETEIAVISKRAASGRFRAVLSLLPSGGRLLEIGCSVGGFTPIMAERMGGQAVGMDVVPEVIEAARRIYAGRPSVTFQVGTVYRTGFPDASFDAVVMLQLLEHLDAPAKAMREINRVLRPGGVAVVSTINAHYWMSSLDFYRKSYVPSWNPGVARFQDHPAARHVTTWDLVSFNTLLSECGFRHRRHLFANVIDDFNPFARAVDAVLVRLVPGLAQTILISADKIRDASKDAEI